MSNHDYSKYSNKKKPANGPKTDNPNRRPIPEAKPETETPEVKSVQQVPEVKPEVKPVVETVETVTLPKAIVGKVSGCAKLNVRVAPSANADVVCVIDVDTEVEIDMTKSDNEWLKVCAAIGAEGYCMRKYIETRL